MKNLFSTKILCALALAAASVISVSAMHDDAACLADATTLAQLKSAQTATARFNSIRTAESEGYTNINLPIPNMGEHWVNWDLVDGVFEPERPEALVYANIGGGRLQLVAVEYLAPLSNEAPSGFAGSCDQWSPFAGALWTLHAWIWYPNMSGTFSKFNPLVP